MAYTGITRGINIIVRPAEKTVECQTQVIGAETPPYSSCKDLVSRIPVSAAQQVFGNAGLPGSQVKLPKIFYSSKFLRGRPHLHLYSESIDL